MQQWTFVYLSVFEQTHIFRFFTVGGIYWEWSFYGDFCPEGMTVRGDCLVTEQFILSCRLLRWTCDRQKALSKNVTRKWWETRRYGSVCSMMDAGWWLSDVVGSTVMAAADARRRRTLLIDPRLFMIPWSVNCSHER